MANNKKAYYACKINNSLGVASYIDIAPINTSKFENGTFSFDIWLYPQEDTFEVLSQNNGIIFGAEKGFLYLKHSEIGTVKVSNTIFKLQKNVWSNVFLTYDKQNVFIYINGYNVYTAAVKSSVLINENSFVIGNKFTGFTRSVRIYSTCIPNIEMKKYIQQVTYSKADMPHIVACIDFNTPSMKDLGELSLGLTPHNLCDVENVIHAYKPSDGSYASIASATEINPGGFESKKFSIYAKFFLQTESREKQVILSNGKFGETDAVIVYLTHVTDDTFKLSAQMGATNFTGDIVINSYDWIDILLCFKNNVLNFFINGNEDKSYTVNDWRRLSKGETKLGNAFDSTGKINFPLNGYMTTVAVFDKALSKQDAVDFYANEPFLYENNLVALLSFENGIAMNFVSEVMIECRDEDVMLVSGTNGSDEISPYVYRMNKTKPNYSDNTIWKSSVVTSIFVEYFNETYGLKANTTAVENFNAYFATELIHEEPFQSIIVDETVSEKEILDAIQSFDKCRLTKFTKLMPLNTSVNLLAGVGPSTMGFLGALESMTVSAFFGSVIKYFAAALAVIAVTKAIVAIIEKIKKDRPEPDDDDEQVSVKILELSLQNTPDDISGSATYLDDCEGPVSVPEWTSSGPRTKAALYIADKIKNVKIKAKIKVTAKGKVKRPIYNISFNAYVTDKVQAFIDSIQGEISCSEGEHIVELTAKKIQKSDSKDIIKYLPKFTWTYNVDGIKDYANSTQLLLYSLPSVPRYPISLEKEHTKLHPMTEFIDIGSKGPGAAETIYAGAVEKVPLKATVGTLTEVTDLLYGNQNFIYDPNGFIYTTHQNHVVQFDVRRFRRDYANIIGNAIHINCLEYATILAYMFSLVDENAHVAIIQTAPPGGQLNTNNLLGAGRGYVPGVFAFNYHVATSRDADGKIYDACCRTAANTTLANLPFSDPANNTNINTQDGIATYRKTVFQPETACIITALEIFVDTDLSQIYGDFA